MSDQRPYIVNKLTNGTAEVLIYEQIGESFFDEGITAKQFAADIKALGDVRRIDVRINSVGGSVFDGLAMFNTLQSHRANIVVHIDGVALSMASVVAMAGDHINMAANGLMMIHNPRMMVAGDENEMRRAITVLEKSKAGLLRAYTDKSQQTPEAISQLMDAETWFTADEAVAAGLADTITSALDVAARVDLTTLPNAIAVPPSVLDRFTKLPKPGGQTMPSTTSETQAATLAELKALNGASPEFILAQLEAGATLSAAVNSLNAKLAEDLRVAREELSKPEATQPQPNPQPTTPPADKPDPSPPTPPPAAPPAAVSTPATAGGVAPFASNQTPGAADDQIVDSGDLQDEFETQFLALRAQGMSAADAMKKLYAGKSKFAQAALAGYEAKTGRAYN